MVKRTLQNIAGVLLVTALVGCAPKSDSMSSSPSKDQIESAISKQNRAFENSFAETDTTQFANVYLADGWMMPPNSKPIKGRGGIKQFLIGSHKMGLTKIELTTREVHPLRDAAIETGSFQIYAGEHPVDHGSYMVYWKMDGDTWRMARDIWNSDSPPANQEEAQ